uniref:Cation-transporting P-type ATPase C-terminal domain-containing protein n=1 Tax=Clastoptera arizonana TaxID=38151 RepID=A0A1B6BXT8_9HEMI
MRNLKKPACITKESSLGLTTFEALNILYEDIQSTLAQFEANKKSRWKIYLEDVFSPSNKHTLLPWTSLVVKILCGLLLIGISMFYEGSIYSNLFLYGVVVLLLSAFNVVSVVWDSKLRHEEVPNKVNEILVFLNKNKDKCCWKPENYPHLCTPYSPCITLQWTYRDGRLVNLPWALLVKGDTVLIRPGQHAPGHCTPINVKECPELQEGEVYSPPPTATAHDSFTAPSARVPLQNQPYILDETPYIKNLKAALEEATNRPITYYNRQRHLLMISCVEQMALPFFVVCILSVSGLRYMYVSDWVGSGTLIEMLILAPISVALPLLPLIFPVSWIFLNAYGNARISALLTVSSIYQTFVDDPFDDTDIGVKKLIEIHLKWSQVKKIFINVLFGLHSDLSRSANILHVLGSVSALCCVDKKGILSWPNPTAEKVFFLRSVEDVPPSPSENSLDRHSENGDVFEAIDRPIDTEHQHHCDSSSQTVAEVLDLTHDRNCPFRLHFDDKGWKQHLPSLKPLGLAILLNTCNMNTQDHYTQFCSHVTCEALYNEDLVPVTNRRCLCELAKQIGFADSAQNIFSLEQQLSTFRHVQPETVRRDIKFARSLALATKLKFPFPHMVAVVVKEKANRGALQLFSQGTADIVLDSCIEFWDGKELCTLSTTDRKKVQDFYQRTSLTAYCTAFAYRPLTRNVSSNLTQVYLELPADSSHLYLPNRSPTPLTWSGGILGHFQSTDSLLGNEHVEDEVSDIDGCFQLQCNQVFIGMVTMQYQAQTDMVQLIEQLERACIRFVHFSKENELRSRVFSEKMGLESGWNCHISLLSERTSTTMGASNMKSEPQSELKEIKDDILQPLLSSKCGTLSRSRAMSMSAPSAINLSVNKIENDFNSGENIDDDGLNSNCDGWQSLSCLTDSTEQSAPVNFDMSNRAKLPRGIDKIRPHLEQVDNVPLLVSLFTDCTPSTTKEMISIMQDYGEVVCVMGSSANADNIGIFLQANACLAVQPQYPQVCQKVSVFQPTTFNQGPSPIQFSQKLNSVPCSISFNKEDSVSIFHLVLESRHLMQAIWNCVQYWICCVITLGSVQLVNTFFMLPPIFTIGQLLWISCIVIPLLSLSMVANPTDPAVMQKATDKNHCLVNFEVSVFVLWCYGSKFLVTLFMTPVIYAATLSSFCGQIVTNSSQCNVIDPSPNHKESWGGWERFRFSLYSAQQVAAFFIIAHFVVISSSFVHREYLSWRRGPYKNGIWLSTAIILLVIQVLFSYIILWLSSTGEPSMFDLSWSIIGTVALSPIIVFLINELVKWQEIKANVRYQKRARLDFGTKLGMNSPF